MEKSIGQKLVEDTINRAGQEKIDGLRTAANEVTGALRGVNTEVATEAEILDLASKVTKLNQGTSNLGDRITAIEKGYETALSGVASISSGLMSLDAGMRTMRLTPDQKQQVISQVTSWVSELLSEGVAGVKKHPEFPLAEVAGNTEEGLKTGGIVLGQLVRAKILSESDIRRSKNRGGRGTKVWLNEHGAVVLKTAMEIRQEFRETNPDSYFFVTRFEDQLKERVRMKEEHNLSE